jgi:hypothetical protein
LRLCLLHVELGLVAPLEQPLGDVEAALLQRGILARDHQPRLQGADRAVDARHLRGHQHLQVVVLRDAREIAGIRRLDAALELAPEVELPAAWKPALAETALKSGPPRLISPPQSAAPVAWRTCG